MTSAGTITVDGLGIASKGAVSIEALGLVTIEEGINNSSGSAKPISITSTGAGVTVEEDLDSAGAITITAAGNIDLDDGTVDNTAGTGSVLVTVSGSAGTVIVNGGGINTNGTVTVLAPGLVTLEGEGIDDHGSGTVSVTSTDAGVTVADGGGIRAKGAITITAAGDVFTDFDTIDNSEGTGNICITTTVGTVTVAGVFSSGNVTISAPGLVSLPSGVIQCFGSTSAVSLTSTGDGIDLQGLIVTNGNITLQAAGAISIDGYEVSNASGTGSVSMTSATGNISIDSTNGILTTTTATLTATAGAITTADTNTDVTATSLVASAATGITLDTAVTNLTAGTTGAGNILLREADGANVLNVAAANGNATVTSATGNLNITSISASGTVTLTATAGSITDGTGGTANDVTANQLILNAAIAIGTSAIPFQFTANTLTTNTSATNGNQYLNVVGPTTVTAAAGGGLVKTGTGSLRLAAGSTDNFNGAVAVNGGVLVVDSALSANANAVTVNSGGILGGTGTINRPLVVNGGTLSPGDNGKAVTDPTNALFGQFSTGSGGNLTNPGGNTSTFTVNLGPTSTTGHQPSPGTDYDQLVVPTGDSISLNNLILNATVTGTIPIGTQFVIVNNQSTPAASNLISGTFNGMPEGAVFTVGATEFQITYQGGDGNDVVLTSVNAPSLTTNPSNQTVTAGNNATFTAAASGNPAPTVQWQRQHQRRESFSRHQRSDFHHAEPVQRDASMNGYEYQAVFTNSIGIAITSAATLTVDTPPAVTTQPANQTVSAGNTATFTAAASGNPAPTVQWQLSTNGGSSFSNISGATSTTLSLSSVTASMNGFEYQAVFTNSVGSVTTSAATLTVNYAPTVTTNPSNQTVSTGNTATFTAAASGNPAPTVQWQLSTDGGGTSTTSAERLPPR